MLFKSGITSKHLVKHHTVSLLLSCVIAGFAHAQPQLQSDTTLATAGYFQLTWQTEVVGTFELQQAHSDNFSDARSVLHLFF